MRADIQRMRAFAVGLVVVFHLSPHLIPGGYIGVDIFFVISGYLITNHLFKEVQETGKLKLFRFWARRIRRLLPAAFTVLAVSAIVSIFLFPRSLLVQNLSEIGFASVYLLNWPLASNAVDYLGQNNAPSIAQHYWSLSVEEQFYFFWPLIFLVVIWIAHWLKTRFAKALPIALVVVFFASLAFSVFETSASQPSAYFLTTTRAWEFALGGLVSLIPVFKVIRAAKRLIYVLSLSALFLTSFLFNSLSNFPGSIALIPVLATGLILWIGSTSAETSEPLKPKFQPIQFIGGISYELYLWHWPVIVLAFTFLGENIGLEKSLVIIFASVFLAAITKKFVSDPIRSAPLLQTRISLNFLIAGLASVSIILICVVPSYAYLQKHPGNVPVTESQAVADPQGCFGALAVINNCAKPYAYTDGVDPFNAEADNMYATGVTLTSECEIDTGSWPQTFDCELNKSNQSSSKMVLIGDSHSYVLAAPMKIAAQMNSWNLESWSATAGCRPFEKLEKEDNTCTAWASSRLKRLVSDKSIETVVVAFSYNLNTGRALDWLNELMQSGKKVIVIRPVPGLNLPESQKEYENSAPVCVEKHVGDYDPCHWTPETLQAPVYPKGMSLLDTWEVFCPDGKCHTVIGGTLVYFDSNHMTTTFAKTLYGWLSTSILKKMN